MEGYFEGRRAVVGGISYDEGGLQLILAVGCKGEVVLGVESQHY
jgi:hypothetical protein